MCGRICGAPCEAACRRGAIDQPISIRALKRFVCETFGSDARSDAGRELFPYLKSKNETRQCDDIEELSHLLEFLANTEFPKPTGERIAIIGSGPAGLAAGHDLALMGFRPTILEMEPQPAGMLYTGVPGYRLPRELIRAEVAVIQSLGVKIRCNTQVGKDVSFVDLRRDFSAVIIACGAKRSRALPIPNAEAIGVMGGVDFLRDVSLRETLNKPVSLRWCVFSHANASVRIRFPPSRPASVARSRSAVSQRGYAGARRSSFFRSRYRFTSAHTANSWLAFFFSPR